MAREKREGVFGVREFTVICDACGARDAVGDTASFPEKWRQFCLNFRDSESRGWCNDKAIYGEKTLCPSCAKTIEIIFASIKRVDPLEDLKIL